jgi:hypothetical protein
LGVPPFKETPQHGTIGQKWETQQDM